jgi:ankyrin repeat protein
MIRHLRIASALLLAAAMLGAGCANKDQERMERGVEFAKSRLNAVNAEQMSATTFQSILESGGTELSYLTASAAPDADLPSFVLDEPSGPYCVVVKYDKAGASYILEGYGEDTAEPAVTEVIKMKTPKVIKSPYKTEDLCRAAMDGKAATVAEMLEVNTDPNGFSSEGCTPLMYGAAIGNAGIVKSLLEAGAAADVQGRNSQRWTPLFYAVHGGSPEVVSMLIEKGADAKALDPYGNSTLMLACLKGAKDLIEPLLEGGCEMDLKERKQGNTALLLACSKNHDDIAEALINAGADVNLADKTGLTPLMVCSERGNVRIATLLIEKNAAVDAKSIRGVAPGATALMMAAAKGKAEAVKLLISKGANLELTDKRGSDALRYAEYNGMSKAAQIIKSAQRGGNKAVSKAVAAEASSESDEESLVGKKKDAADSAFGRPIGKVKKGSQMVIFYRSAEVVTDQRGIIKSVELR